MSRAVVLALLLILPMSSAWGEPPRLAPGQRVEGRFVQERHLKGFNSPLRSEGRFLLAPGKGLLWKSEKPFATISIMTDQGIVQLIDGVEASRLSAARAPFLTRFYEMLGGALLGDLGALERDFTVKREGGTDTWRLAVAPRAPDGPVGRQIESILISGTRFADAVEIVKTGGDRERLVFSEQRVMTGPLAAEDAALFAAGAK